MHMITVEMTVMRFLPLGRNRSLLVELEDVLEPPSLLVLTFIVIEGSASL